MTERLSPEVTHCGQESISSCIIFGDWTRTEMQLGMRCILGSNGVTFRLGVRTFL